MTCVARYRYGSPGITYNYSFVAQIERNRANRGRACGGTTSWSFSLGPLEFQREHERERERERERDVSEAGSLAQDVSVLA